MFSTLEVPLMFLLDWESLVYQTKPKKQVVFLRQYQLSLQHFPKVYF